LQQYLEQNAETFRIEPRFDLRQIYVSLEDGPDEANARAQRLLEQLRNTPDTDWSALGNPLPLPGHVTDAGFGELERQFGKKFVDILLTIKPGDWTGPVESAYGLHLVIIDRFTPARDAKLDEVRNRVQTEWLDLRRRTATDALYARLSAKYSIEIEPLTESASR